MNILGITIMRTKKLERCAAYRTEILESRHKESVATLNAEIARLREIEAEHTRWTDRGPDGRFVRNE